MFRAVIFNPYCQWLGLAAPPSNHYELLGLERTQASPAAIESAASRQLQRLAQTGDQIAIVKKIQVEIRLAQRCLLDPESKREYDRRLSGERSERMRWRMVKTRPPRSSSSAETVTDVRSHVTPAA